MTKAFTLHQPWASLVALGVKTIETRSWSTRHRGRLLIHAGLTVRPGQEVGDYCYEAPAGGSEVGWVARTTERDGYTDEPIPEWVGDPLHVGWCWTAYVGADDDDVPVLGAIASCVTSSEARDFVEERIIARWKELRRTRLP